MKRFTESEGKFTVKIPIEWEYRNTLQNSPKGDPHQFVLYENPIGCFQISSNSISKGHIPKIIIANNLQIQDEGKTKIDFTGKVLLSDNFDTYLWMAVVKDEFFLVEYIYDSALRDSILIKDELEKAKNTLPTIIFVKQDERRVYLEFDRFDKFMSSIAATIDLRNRAYENGSFIELVVLLANHIDALLRLSLILTSQIKNQNYFIDTSLLFQGESDKPIMEKKIYQMALDENIITQELYDKLVELYNERNKVVHRYIITDIKTRDVIKIVMDYEELQEKMGLLIENLEQKQFQMKVGIYGTDTPPNRPLDEIGIRTIIASVKDKHGNKKFSKKISISKKNCG